MALYTNQYDRDEARREELARYEAQLERMDAVKVAKTLTDREIVAEYEDYHNWQLDIQFTRSGGN